MTERERQVAELLERGLSDAEIARALGIAPDTAGWHRRHVEHARYARLLPRVRAVATVTCDAPEWLVVPFGHSK